MKKIKTSEDLGRKKMNEQVVDVSLADGFMNTIKEKESANARVSKI